jgi:hypothetical protein
MWQRIALAGLLVLLFGFAAEAACVKHTPSAEFAAAYQLGGPGVTVTNDVRVENRDSAECPGTCFQLSPGWRTPHDDGTFFAYVQCLAPGAAVVARYHLTFGLDQDGPGYVVESVFVTRPTARTNSRPEDIFVDEFDLEGHPACVGYDTATCWGFAYPSAALR